MALFQTVGAKEPKPVKERSTTGKILRYSMLPGILPRIRALGFHFGHFAYLLALIFNSARLIPNNHPVLNAANIGRFGVRQVIALAANNITWSKANIDQIAIFSAIVIGLLMIAVQAILIGIYALVGTVYANEAGAASFFTPTNANYNTVEDPIMIAFAQIFGELNGFWGPFDEASAPGINSGIQLAVHNMLSLYSKATMVIAVIIVLYYILTIIAEAAQTGTPFGRRFNSVWAPIRLVIALGLLVPLGSGLNSAQYITLWVAKMGSGLGSNMWFLVADSITQKPERFSMAKFEVPWVRDAAARIFIMEVCRHAENKMQGGSANITPVFLPLNDTENGVHGFTLEYKNEEFRPRYCGKMQIRLTSGEDSSIAKSMAVPTRQVATVSGNVIQRLIANDGVISNEAEKFADCNTSVGGRGSDCPVVLEDTFRKIMEEADKVEEAILSSSVEDFSETYEKQVEDLKNKMQRSWIYAGVWYLEFGRLLQASKDLTASSVPNMTAGSVRTERTAWNEFWRGAQVGTESLRSDYADFNASVQLEWTSRISHETETAIIIAARHYFTNINEYIDRNAVPQKCVDINTDSGYMAKIGCAILGMLVPENLVILADPNYKTLDPMTSLINAGKEITDRSIVYIGYGLGAAGASVALSIIPKWGSFLSSVASGISKMLLLFGTIGLGAGLILSFLLPLFPFIYLFFAAVSWIMEIFEAIVAMPLWALAHLRIDGEGMPGQAAINGYFLLLAILLRPGLIVVGMVGGALIFSASIYMLQTLFRDVIMIQTGGSATGLEILIYAIVFAYLCYTAGITSFKLVDQVPNQILRWIGAGVSTFSEGREDPIGGNNQMALAAAGVISGQAVGAMSEIASSPGQALQGYMKDKQDKKDQAASAERHNEMLQALRGFKEPQGGGTPSGGGGSTGGGGTPTNPSSGGGKPKGPEGGPKGPNVPPSKL